jgi:endonuclease/exonuclease/phosphatase family metal-dependent hydrolase
MLAIDQKVGVQSQDFVPLMEFGHAYDARIRQRHRGVAILLKQPAHLTDLLLDPERNTERAILQEVE